MRVCVCVCLTSLDTQCTILNNRGPDFWEFLQWLGSNYHLPGIQGVCVCACVCVCVCDTAHQYVLWCIHTCDLTHSLRFLHPGNDLYVCIHFPCRVWHICMVLCGRIHRWFWYSTRTRHQETISIAPTYPTCASNSATKRYKTNVHFSLAVQTRIIKASSR